MSRRFTTAAAVVAAGAFLALVASGRGRAEPLFGSSGPSVSSPRLDPPPGGLFGPDGPVTGRSPPGIETPSKVPPETEPPKPPSRAEMLDRLFARLAQTRDADESAGVAGLIERLWMRSGSDTADLLMTRALDAMHTSHGDVAEDLLDRIVVLQPRWAEGWNKRATLRFMQDDDAGAMEDIGHVLLLEPRHFGALAGMGFILKRNGLDKAALTVFRKVEALYPGNADIRKAVDDLTPEVEGRDL